MNKLHIVNLFSSKFPLLRRLFIHQATVVVAGFCLILGLALFSNKIANEAALKTLKEEIFIDLSSKADQLLAWKALGLDDAIDNELAAIYMKWPIKKINFVNSDVEKVDLSTEDVIVIDKFSVNGVSNYKIIADLKERPLSTQHFLNTKVIVIMIIFILLFILILLFSQKYILNEIHRPLIELQEYFDKYKQGEHAEVSSIIASGEMKEFIENISALYKQNVNLQSKTEIAEIARQVAHDIRSPIGALNMTIAGESHLNEEKKALIKASLDRINDIANDLLLKSKVNKVQSVLLNKLISEVVSEKNAEHKSNDINFEFSESGDIFYVSAHESDLKRIISNILNNSVEAKSASAKLDVSCVIKKYKSHITASISDNGVGIPLDFIENVGKRGWSYSLNGSKRSYGSGLGLSYGISKMREWGGELKISSKENVGTIVTLMWPV